MRGELVSVNVGQPRVVEWKGKQVETGIFKSPVDGRVRVDERHVEGDRQADLRNHGGVHKAVYAYPEEHYAFWSEQYPGKDLPPGMFGENLTTRGFDEGQVQIGDRFRIGTAVLEASEPRLPCSKLAIRFGETDVVKRFFKSGKPGVYCRIIAAGDLSAGDEIELVDRRGNGLTVRDVMQIYAGVSGREGGLDLAAACPALSDNWKSMLRDRAN